jgi:CHAD domain-containing protein
MARGIRLETDEPVPEGVRRIAREQLDLVAQQLAGKPGDREIHEARKAFKRLRTLLRVAREEVGEDVRRRENAAFRDAGRTMSDARDARILLETLDDLVEPGAFQRLRDQLRSESTQAQERVDAAAVLATVEDARGRVASWPPGDDDPLPALAAGLTRIHRRGRRAYETARGEPSAEHLHELRKRAKDLRYATQILRSVAPARMRKLSRRAKRLSDVLGEDHDLATLHAASVRHPQALSPAERELLDRLIDHRRADLRDDALRRARKLYAAKPRKLARLVA